MEAGPRRWGGGPYDRPLEIAIVTQEDPFYIGTFFDEFLHRGAEHRDVARIRGVFVQDALGSGTGRGLAARVWSLYGTLGFIRMGFRYLGAKLVGRGIDERCREAGVPVPSLPAERSIGGARAAKRPPRRNNVNGPAFHAWVREQEIDLIVSVSASQIFGKTVLSLPTIGCVNLHNAPLPKYRGMLPNFRQMYDRREVSVLTIHEMVPDLDQGAVLHRGETPIAPGMSLEELMTATKRSSARALWEFLATLHRGEATATPLTGEGSYYTWPTRREVREFRRRGGRVW